MVDKVGHIKNPLTVIAIFAAIAEISGTGILPFIETTNQSTYIWFLMLFPAFLVAVFFATLNFNHRVLYAPSDYKDESNFLKIYGNIGPEEQQIKLSEEIYEAIPSATDTLPGPKASTSTVDLESINREYMATYSLAEKLVMIKLSKDLKLNIGPGVKFDEGIDDPIIYDGMAIKESEFHAIEVKVILNEKIVRTPGYSKMFKSSEQVSRLLKRDNIKFFLHLALVTGVADADIEKWRETIDAQLKEYNVKIVLHLWRMSELEKEVMNPLNMIRSYKR